DVKESRQLPGTEAILDLLLEPTDEKHLAKECAQDLPGYAGPSGSGPLFDGRHRAAIMLIRRCGPPTSGRRSRRASTPTGPKSRSRSSPKGPSRTPRRCSGRFSPAASGTSFGSMSSAPREGSNVHATSSDGWIAAGSGG